MEEICERKNLEEALRRVVRNQGAPGVDGMSTEVLPEYLRTHWPVLREQLLKGSYRPQSVKRVKIPKPSGNGTRNLGIPTVVDRFIQQAVLQVLQGKWDATFSESSYGFRPGRSAHQAVEQAQRYLRSGYEYVVDIDLEKFFDRVNHDKLISALAERIADKRVLKLIRSYLRAGVMETGLVSIPEAGTPQGGPLSPFLSNVVLDALDKELEKRGHRFVRYADDCNIYVRSQRAGERVMQSISRFITQRLKLKINQQKSAVARPQERTFLGFSFTGGRHPHRKQIAPESLRRFKRRVRQLTRRSRQISLEERIQRLSVYLRGWKAYFGLAETSSVFRDLDSWIRRRLRCIVWKQWKTYRRRKRELIKRGVRESLAFAAAWSNKGPWCICHTPSVRMALPNSFFDSLGLPRLSA
ncbi:MAG: group II intron reverse transcriptase/maturase [Leptolyngbya sp. SIO4C1]|nr:group II intron reverse transcriptase/maturase [Leptolyngbya sp. SIO4C1]